jgi:hypothetical protein
MDVRTILTLRQNQSLQTSLIFIHVHASTSFARRTQHNRRLFNFALCLRARFAESCRDFQFLSLPVFLSSDSIPSNVNCLLVLVLLILLNATSILVRLNATSILLFNVTSILILFNANSRPLVRIDSRLLVRVNSRLILVQVNPSLLPNPLLRFELLIVPIPI